MSIAALPLQVNAADKTLKITNKRDAFPIWHVYITPAGQSDWGSDQLGEGKVIGVGESYSWTIPWDGCYVDVQAKTFTGLIAEKRDLNVCGGFEWTLRDANPKQQSKKLKVINKREAFPIWKVYITPAGQSNWGQDQLGEGVVIGAGESYTWDIPWDGCYVDVKAVTFTGLEAEQRNLNVCGGRNWHLSD
ncbi:hypothetical protein C8R27_12623 [Nitrosomonas ureae]|uniref:hypothetical protein n=1 Tax=Nitrosomonas ureae TaxID=44577 RepID=UPI000D894D28|nr:hypothetical protein [Nitrosomonas ureae]PXX11855.1 hypothetical protein C8R27_12623 [Nitrosomonas ureae]